MKDLCATLISRDQPLISPFVPSVTSVCGDLIAMILGNEELIFNTLSSFSAHSVIDNSIKTA